MMLVLVGAVGRILYGVEVPAELQLAEEPAAREAAQLVES